MKKLILILALIGGLAQAQTNLLLWSNNGTNITITGHGLTVETNLTIDPVIDGLPVTAIGTNAFFGYQGSSFALTVSTNLVTIGNSAFFGSYLTSIGDLPSLTTIGVSAFGYSSLGSLGDMPSLVTIGASAFDNCASLTNLTLSGNAPTLGGAGVFTDSALTRVNAYSTTGGWDDNLGGLPVYFLDTGGYIRGDFFQPIRSTYLCPEWMRYSLWSTSVSWIASGTILNAKTTNATWLCYAKTCGGNFVNKVLANQPVRTNLAGVAALYFDGSDALDSNTNSLGPVDFRFTASNAWTWTAWYNIASNSTAYLIAKAFSAAATNTTFAVLLYRSAAPSYTPAVVCQGGAISALNLGADNGTWNHGAVTWDGSTAKYWHNGTYRTNLPVGAQTNGDNSDITIGRSSSKGILTFTGYLADTVVFEGALSTADVMRLYKQTSGGKRP